MTAAGMKRKWQGVKGRAPVWARQIIDASDKQLIELLQKNMRHGLDGYDKLITNQRTGRGYASDTYADLKQNMGSEAPWGTPDLKLHGGFYSGMAISWLTDNSFSIISNDVKWRKLMQMYGLDTMKLSAQAINYFIINRFRPSFIRMLADATGTNYS